MGKIVKYCSACDEGFAEKFGFCPNCAAPLKAFEMSPVVPPTPPAAVITETPAIPATPKIIEPVEIPENVQHAAPAGTDRVAEAVTVPELEIPEIEVAPSKAADSSAVSYVSTKPIDVDKKPDSLEAAHSTAMHNGEYYVTVIEEKNVKQRNILLAGSFGLMLAALMFGLVYSIFSKELNVGSINDDIFNAVIVDNVPMTVEEEKKQADKKDAGGGGGGGRDEKEETTRGDLANQTKDPIRPPDAKVFRSDNFELKMPPPETEGNKKYERKYDRWGDPNGRFDSFSNGTGTGGGQGSGVGTGQGSGRGTGNGSGTGSGSGSGLGTGNGGGSGAGDDGAGEPPPPRGVTQGVKIISRPRPGYTDAARQNNIQGSVILRVVFLASGQIGSISPVKGLPNGLTEQAIAAARRISFEPAKTNGVAQSVTKQVEYSFSIY